MWWIFALTLAGYALLVVLILVLLGRSGSDDWDNLR